jgi:hypothetical protein
LDTSGGVHRSSLDAFLRANTGRCSLLRAQTDNRQFIFVPPGHGKDRENRDTLEIQEVVWRYYRG